MFTLAVFRIEFVWELASFVTADVFTLTSFKVSYLWEFTVDITRVRVLCHTHAVALFEEGALRTGAVTYTFAILPIRVLFKSAFKLAWFALRVDYLTFAFFFIWLVAPWTSF